MASKKGLMVAISKFFGLQRASRRIGPDKQRYRFASESLEQRQLLVAPVLLSSLPGAPVTVFLDVDGHTETDPGWINFRSDGQSGPIVTPAFDLDNNPATFNAAETQWVSEIWARVAEDYAPFQINVTTVDPGAINDFEAVRVVIGGDGAWSPALPGGGRAGGYGTYGFNSGASNTSFVFSELFSRASDLASISSHESGHTFGLGHHSSWNADGTKNQEYNPGTAARAPIMGNGYSAARDVWDNGPGSVAAATLQDDLAVLTSAANRTIAFRADDYGNTTGTAFDLFVTNPVITQQGLIGRNNDVDYFMFETDAGNISFSANGINMATLYNNPALTQGTNADLELRLYNASGTLLATDAPGNRLSAALTVTVQRGVYYVAVSGTGEYGALGQYTLGGNVIPLPSTPTLLGPAGTTASLTPNFSWTASANAVSYELEVDSVTKSVAGYYKAKIAAPTLAHLSLKTFEEGTYKARVRSVASNGTFSPWSSDVQFIVAVPLPSRPTIIRPGTATGESFPTFEWTKGPNDKSFNLQVFKKGTTTRVIHKTNQGTNTYVHFVPLADGDYTVNVRAFNAVNKPGAISESVDFKVTSPTLVAPRLTAPIGTSTSTQPRFAWTAVTGATFYKLVVQNLSRGTVQFTQENLPRTKTFFDPPVMPQGNYRVYVQAVSNNIGADGKYIAGPSTGWQSFTLDILPPAAPSVTGPRGLNDSPTITTTNPRFTWTVPARGVKYDLLVNNVTTQVAGVIRENGLTSTSFIARTNMAQGQYRAWVRAYNAANEVGDWSLPFDFNIDEPTPSVPVITAPVVNSLGYVEDANPTFRWTTTTPAAAAYDFTLFNVSLGTTAFTVNDLTTASYAVPAASRLGEYVYRAQVRAKNVSGDATEWSAPYTIRVNIPDPTTPTLIGPGDTITDTTPTFSWRHTSTSFSYEILIRDLLRNEDISLQVKTFSLDPGGATASYTLPDAKALKPGTYRFWVRALNSLGQASGWSTSRTFVITVKLDDSLQNSPAENPDQLVASRITPALANRNSVTTKATSADARSEDSQPQEEVVATDFVAVVAPSARDRRTAIPEVPGEESLIDAFMHRIADPSSDADFTFLKS